MNRTTILSLTAMGAALCAGAYAEMHTGGHHNSILNPYLAKDYYWLAQSEEDKMDIKDSYIFMDKSAKAVRGHPVYPVRLDGLNYVDASPQELRAGREALVRVLKNPNTVNNNPAAVARAQVLFDCWAVHQQAGPNASHNLLQCEDKFKSLISQLDQGPAPVAAMPVKWRVVKAYNVYFDWDKHNIRPDAAATLDEIKATMANPENETKRIAIGGHADASGPVDYNQRLSERRVRAVAEYLNVTPVSAEEVDLRAYGENNLPVPTADGVRLQANRVAKVAIVEIEE
jgi:OOP family OmpA-OmpF porin